MRYLLLFLCLGNTWVLNAGSVDPVNLDSILAKAREESNKGQFLELLTTLNKLYQVQENNDSLYAWISACKEIGRTLDENGHPLKAIEVFELADLENIWRKPNSEPEWDLMGSVYANMAYVYEESLDNLRSAKEAYEKALWVFDEQLCIEDDYVGQYIIAPLGNLTNKTGDFEAAEVFISRYKKIAKSQGDWIAVANACSDLGVLYLNMHEFEKGIAVCEEGLSIKEIDRFSKALLQGNYARLLRATEEYERAKALNEDSFNNFSSIYEAGYPIGAYFIAQVLVISVDIDLQTNNYLDGEDKIELAEFYLSQYQDDKGNRDFAKLYVLKSKFYLEWQKPEKAMTAAHQALRALLDQFLVENTYELPLKNQLYAENTLQEALAYKAEAFEQLAEEKNDPELLKKALQCHELIFEVEKQIRRSLSYETSKLYVLEESRERSEHAIEIALRLWETTNDPVYKEEALAFAERSKSILLLEAFRKVEAAQLGGLPDSLMQEEYQFQAQIALTEKRLFTAKENKESDQITPLENELLKLRQAYNDWILALEEAYPQFYNLKYNFETLDIDQIRETMLKDDEAVIEYFVGMEHVYAFYISSTQFDIIKIKKDFPLEEWIRQLRTDMEQFQYDTADRSQLISSYIHLSNQLYHKLLKPLPDLPEHICIIPSGMLGYLPFEALLSAQPQKIRDFSTYPYLINDHVIHYTYSISLQKSLIEKQTLGSRYAGFAPAFMGGADYNALKYSQEAVAEVAGKLNGDPVLGAEATIQKFRELAHDYQLIQLATHAVANMEQGDFSYIVFADGKGGYDSMFVKDVYLLNLSADLVMLSACETAVGELYKGEGIINLARAFFYAGSKSVVTTLWSINEEANKKITTRFYELLRTGKTKKEALHEAKLDYLHESGSHFSHPVYWAAFTPIGDMEAVYEGHNWPMSFLYGGLGLLLLAGIWWLGRKPN